MIVRVALIYGILLFCLHYSCFPPATYPALWLVWYISYFFQIAYLFQNWNLNCKLSRALESTNMIQDIDITWLLLVECMKLSLVPTPAFVACSTNTGEGLVKLSHLVWHTWTCGGVAHSRKTASKWVCYQSQTQTIERLSAWHQTVLATFLGFRKPLYSCTKGMCHSSIGPGISHHVTQFYQAFPHEKAWVRGYMKLFTVCTLASTEQASWQTSLRCCLKSYWCRLYMKLCHLI